MNIKTGLTFDDALLIPKYSSISSRFEIDLSVSLSKGISVKFPVMPANMASISSLELFQVFYKYGSILPLHRFLTLDQQLQFFEDVKFVVGDDATNYFGFSVGVKQEDYDNLPKLISSGAKIIVIDIAHGDSKKCVDMVSHISETYPDIFLIAGNVATADGADRLWRAGADAVKAGIGASMVCTTRTVSGCGYPQLSMLSDVYDRKLSIQKEITNRQLFLISDGGCRMEADFVKSLCFADLVMAGGYFAGSEECPGTIIIRNGKRYKEYNGSSTLKNRVEGVKGLAEVKPSVVGQIEKIIKGIQSGCSYQGVSNLTDLKRDPQFVQISHAGLIESHPHDILFK